MKKLLLLIFLYTSTFLGQTPSFIKVSGGSFTMGDNTSERKNEKPSHQVKNTDFYMSKTQVTVSEYRKYCESRGIEMPRTPSWGWKDNHPIVNVKWSNARNYCNWLRTVIKKNVMLPTEAQWEYAAKGGEKSKKYKHSGGRKLNSVGWYKKNSNNSTQPVRKKEPNALGLYDMNGNVWEWCMDWYDPNYYNKRTTNLNPQNKTIGDKKSKSVRGGAWDSDETTCTVTHRKGYITKSSFDDRGFRVVYTE